MTQPNIFVKIPKSRIAVLIGPNASTKRLIERKLGVRLDVDSDSGDVQVNLTTVATDPSMLFRAKEIVLSIGRGFSPEKAQKLLYDDEAVLTIIDLRDYVGKSESDIKRLSGRIIGANGKTRKVIEELTETHVSVSGHTVSIIGAIEESSIGLQVPSR
jgi:ribosomal RNA assembly protein